MHLLLTAATAAEIQPAVDHLAKKGSSYYPFSTEILITGVTATATAYWLTKNIAGDRPSLIIQAGIAGSFDPVLIGEVLCVNEDIFADCGVWENGQFKTVFDLGLADPVKAPFTGQLLVNPYTKLLALTGLQSARAITVNEISTRPAMIDWYSLHQSPAIESMEGAALHYVCLLEKIPFLQLRSVSNRIGERDKSKWKITEAIGNLNTRLISLLDKLSLNDETYFRI